MVGSGCRGLALARSLVAEGHAVRAVTRSEERREELEAAGCECWIGDPDRIGTLRYALENATVLLWSLGTVDVPELHGSRLEMMLERTVDTTVRGVIYENPPTHPGAGVVQAAHDRHGIPIAFLDADPRDVDAWVAEARAGIDSVLATAR
jgi:predicted dinucleotide-binding enzyme